MVARTENEDRQLASRRQGALLVLLPALVLLLLLGSGAGYIALSEQPVRVGPYTVLGPRCSSNFLWLTLAPAGGNGTVATAFFAQNRGTARARGATMVVTARGGPGIAGRIRWQFCGMTILGP